MVWLKLTRPRTLATIPAYDKGYGHPPDLLVPVHGAVSLRGRYPRAPVRVRSDLPGVSAPARYQSGFVSQRSVPDHGCRQASQSPGRGSVRGSILIPDHTRCRDRPKHLDGNARKRRDRLLARRDPESPGSSAPRSCLAPSDLIHPFILAVASAFSSTLVPPRSSARHDAARKAWPALLNLRSSRLGPMKTPNRLMRDLLTGLTCILFAGCATVDPKRDYSAVTQHVIEATGQSSTYRPDQEDAVESRVEALLAGGMTADEAVQVCLVNNPGFQAA